jgi:hypothetical protein
VYKYVERDSDMFCVHFDRMKGGGVVLIDLNLIRKIDSLT